LLYTIQVWFSLPVNVALAVIPVHTLPCKGVFVIVTVGDVVCHMWAMAVCVICAESGVVTSMHPMHPTRALTGWGIFLHERNIIVKTSANAKIINGTALLADAVIFFMTASKFNSAIWHLGFACRMLNTE
jgi:hypothetical protein